MINGGGYNRTPVEQRILSACSRDEATGCFKFTRRCDKDGYGQISHNSKTRPVHRVMWELKNGSIPEGMVLIHLCDDKYPVDSKEYRSCCEITHLKIGTPAENSKRMADLGRWRSTGSTFKAGECSGEANAACKITDETLLNIHNEIQKGVSYGGLKRIANRTGVSYQMIQKIAGGTYPRLLELLKVLP